MKRVKPLWSGCGVDSFLQFHGPPSNPLGGARGLSKSVISRLTIGVSPFRVLIALLITYLLSPLGL